jgi:hypothetical protein
MKTSNIDAAYILAQEFCECVEDLRKEESARKSYKDGQGDYHTVEYPSKSHKHRGALRRKSMDLTRALAEMRKP